MEDVLAAAEDRYGAGFAEVVASSAVWVNGTPAERGQAVTEVDEVAVLPPVSGGRR